MHFCSQFSRSVMHSIFVSDTFRAIRPEAQNVAPRVILADKRAWDVWGQQLTAIGLTQASPRLIIAPETRKTFALLTWILEAFQNAGVRRRDLVAIVGGGTLSDAGGLAAALFMRGLPYVLFPTTLVAQIDAAIGGKTGVEFGGVKNLVGTFHYPEQVHVIVETLMSVESFQMRQGIAEAIKVGIIGCPELFAMTESSAIPISGSWERLPHLVRLAIQTKLGLLEPDPLEKGTLDRTLNLGHEVAHALEGVDSIAHGDAVSVGIAAAARVAVRLGRLTCGDAHRIERALERVGLPTTHLIPLPAPFREQVEFVRRVRAGHLRVVIPTAIGAVDVVEDMDTDTLISAVRGER